MRSLCRMLFACATLLVLANVAQAGKFNKVLNIGDPAPAWEKLIGTDDQKHSLTDLKDAKAVVVAFTCNHCPVAQAYEERFATFAKNFKKEGVAFVAINVSTIEPDRLDKMKERAEQQGFNFPYLFDESQQIGKAYGAAATPSVFVLDGERKVVYMGAFDANINRRLGDRLYVEEATQAVLEGQQPEITESRPSGCPIKYDEP